METETSKTIFIEYESYGKDRHFMTVLQTLGFRKVVVGRIFKEYDHTSKTSTYRAVDFNGDEIFGTTDHLLDLKSKFKKHGRFLAEGIIAMRRNKDQSNLRFPYLYRASRSNELKNLHETKTEKTQSKERVTARKNAPDKTGNQKVEKEKDNSSPHGPEGKEVLNKQGGPDDHIRDNDTPFDSPTESNDDNSGEFHDEQTEREMEIDQIRSESEDRDQDLEIDF